MKVEAFLFADVANYLFPELFFKHYCSHIFHQGNISACPCISKHVGITELKHLETDPQPSVPKIQDIFYTFCISTKYEK